MKGLSTRSLLTLAALGALAGLVLLALLPVAGALAVLSPPVYGVVIGVQSVLPFLSRRMLPTPVAATLVSLFAGLLTGAFSTIGYVILVPLLVGGATYDLTAWLLLRRRPERGPGGRSAEWRWSLAAVASAGTLFLVSLPVFSVDDLVPGALVATLAGRVAGQLGASLLAGVLSRRLARAGVAR